jgi:hypothetical protein
LAATNTMSNCCCHSWIIGFEISNHESDCAAIVVGF